MNNVTFKQNPNDFVSLPKWPALVVTGEKVTPKQAAEILLRTDLNLPDFQYASNDREFTQQLQQLFNYPDSFIDQYDKWTKFTEQFKKLNLSYLHNCQIASSYIGGPHGWCNWNGNVFSNNYNIGKWPSFEEVTEDWALIAEAFPYLNLTCWLFDGEHCEDRPLQAVVEYVIKDGQVIVRSPELNIIYPTAGNLENDLAQLFTNPHRERGISIDDLIDKLQLVYGEIFRYE